MKRIRLLLLTFILLVSAVFPITAFADGDGNMDGGGGGMGSGTAENFWNTGDEGARVTIVRASDHAVVTTSIDYTNKSPIIKVHFGKISKLKYKTQGIQPTTGSYICQKPNIPLPKIITTSSGNANIEAIKSYFCSEYVVKMIAIDTGMNYDVLINGEYKILVEPIAYMTFQGVKIAVTATEAALYDQQLGGGLRSKMVSLSHKNLPLAIFLETSDLGYPAWSGSKTKSASNADIIASLGIGIVRFKENLEEPPEVSTYDYEYRVNTDVITAVTISGGQSDPDNPVSVSFNIKGTNYNVGNVYYPDGDSQLAWVRWRTPSTPQTMTIDVTVRGGGSSSKGTIHVKIVDLDKNPPPNPVADDRNDSFSPASTPSKAEQTSASWGVWRPWWQPHWVWISDWDYCSHGSGDDEWGHWVDNGWWEDHGWWEFDFNRYSASLSATNSIVPDEKNPTKSGKTMKSGYGINQTVTTNVSTNQSSAVTDPQNAVSYFPEFGYETYWRLLERVNGGYASRFEFKPNEYSTYKRRTHFTPIWYPDGAYTPYTWLIDCWTPAGMLSMNLTDTVTISGNLWMDWHVAPIKP